MLPALPLVFALAGLALYTILAGADFGAGFWQLFAGTGERGASIREHAHHSIAPVWEANHVWLIFVITVFWTAYPVAFGSVFSTLEVPLFIAAIGIIFRGAAYALRSGATGARTVLSIDTVFSVSSLLTPFALGAAVGGVASERVPVGNAAGSIFGSWLNPTSVMIGVLAVATSTYLAAVYLAADAARQGEPELERAFRVRALGAGVLTGALSLVGLAVLHSDAHSLYHELVTGDAIGALAVSGLTGFATLALVLDRRFEAARYSAALAVTAIVAGWAIARWPVLLPGLTIQHAAASHGTLVALVVAVLAGGAILFPSLALLFRLSLTGRLHGESAGDLVEPADRVTRPPASRLRSRLTVACLIVGLGLLNVADANWAHAVGVLSLFAFMVSAYLLIVPAREPHPQPAEEALSDGR